MSNVEVIKHTRSEPWRSNHARFERLLVELEYFTSIERPLDCSIKGKRGFFYHVPCARMIENVEEWNKDDLKKVLREYGEALIELAREDKP